MAKLDGQRRRPGHSRQPRLLMPAGGGAAAAAVAEGVAGAVARRSNLFSFLEQIHLLLCSQHPVKHSWAGDASRLCPQIDRFIAEVFSC